MALDASYFVSKALQNSLPWTTLAMILKDLAPTLDEANDVISILLKELESLQAILQQRDTELEKYLNQSRVLIDKTKEEKAEEQNMALEEETNFDDTNETETIEDDDELLEGVEEKINEEMYLDINEGTKSTDENTTYRNENNDLNSEKTIIDNEWYIFVTNDKNAELENKEPCENIGSNTNEIDEIISMEDNSKNHAKFKCITCQKQFKTSTTLKIHERIHTGELPFECKTCKKRFNLIRSLKIHERIHTGEAPFECMMCKKRFKEKAKLKIHERSHTGEVPYVCKTCNMRFKQSSHLRRHERTHSGKVAM